MTAVPIKKLVAGLLVAVAVPAGVALGASALTAGPTPPIDLVMSSPGFTSAPGYKVTRAYSVSRNGVTGPAVVSVAGLPAGATAVFTPSPLPEGQAGSVRIDLAGSTPEGDFPLTFTATVGSHTSSETRNLHVETPVLPFKVTGVSTGPLAPGRNVGIGLELRNTQRSDIAITDLTVRIARITAPNATPTLTCTTKDFEVRQLGLKSPATLYPLVVPGESTRHLKNFGIPPVYWPRVVMRQRATVNQDGCKGATITYAFGGTAVRSAG